MQLGLFPSSFHVRALSNKTYHCPVVDPYPAQRFIESANSASSISRIKVNQIALVVFHQLIRTMEINPFWCNCHALIGDFI